ncbi:MAG: FAD-dependent monooxygenase [Polymorphobacter sp.]
MTDTLIVGGGLAGAAAATLLAQAGVRPLLVERDTGPADKICGEFLSTEAQAHLAALGFDLARLGGAPISRVRLIAGARQVEARLPFTAIGVSRRRLDAALLDHAAAAGAKVERGVTVRSIDGNIVQSSAGDIMAHQILLGSGKHEVRGCGRDSTGCIDDLIGFKQYFRVDAAAHATLAGIIEVHLFDGGYAGLQLVEGGVVNLCLLVSRARFAALGRSWEALFAALLAEPQLERRLAGAQPLLAKPLTISGVPYGFVHRAQPADPATLFRLGDQAAVIPSFSGDGMSIALHSGRLAATTLARGGSAGAYHARLRGDIARQVRLATWLQRAGFSGAGQRLMLGVIGVAPALLGAIAAATRVPEPALRRAGLAAPANEHLASAAGAGIVA